MQYVEFSLQRIWADRVAEGVSIASETAQSSSRLVNSPAARVDMIVHFSRS